jgi:transcriptional enhancer factor
MKPAIFWLLITSAKTREGYVDLYEKDTVAHRYTRLSSQAPSVNLDTISNWRQMFPYLESIHDAGELTCGIIHMDVSLELMEIHAQDGADLVTRSEMLISGQDAETCEWQTITSLMKPAELCQGDIAEPQWRPKVTTTSILTASETETRLKVRFPVEEWAQLFTHLTDIQLKYEESQRCQHFGGGSYINAARPARELVHQISMYQEVQSCPGPGMPFIRRAIILWTFQAAAPGEVAQTNWRYVDSIPSSSCISPSPHPLQLSAVMNDNLNAWGGSTSHLQHQDVLDPYVHGLVTPSSTAGLHSSCRAYDFRYPDQGFELPSENFSFESTTTVDGESVLADSVTTRNIESFLSNTTTVDIGDYHHAPPTWSIPYAESVSQGPAWVNYATISPSTAHIEHGSGTGSHSWPIDSDPMLTHWAGYRDVKDGLPRLNNAKPKHTYIEKGDDKLLPWVDSAGNEFKDISVEDDDGQLPHLSAGATDTTETGWIGNNTGFDFNQLVERLRS